MFEGCVPQSDAISPDGFKDCTTAIYFRSIYVINAR